MILGLIYDELLCFHRKQSIELRLELELQLELK